MSRQIFAALVLVLAVFGVVTATTAQAAPSGTVLVIPGEGADVAAIRLRPSVTGAAVAGLFLAGLLLSGGGIAFVLASRRRAGPTIRLNKES